MVHDEYRQGVCVVGPWIFLFSARSAAAKSLPVPPHNDSSDKLLITRIISTTRRDKLCNSQPASQPEGLLFV